jgi:methyl-accepting chemotaxis protein
MSWKNLNLNGKFGISFGLIILLLIFVAFWAIQGIRSIVSDAEEVIDGNKLKANIIQKEVDHLNWANAVSDLLNDEEVHTLNAQTDPKKCGFGKWYYSDERKKATELVPKLEELFNQIEEPHKHLHESAIKIQDNYVQVDAQLGTFLAEKKADHLNWMNTVRKEILSNRTRLSVQKDPHQCGLGKWMYSDEVKEMAKANIHLEEFLKNVENPHNELHRGIGILENYLRANNRAEAVRHLNNVSEKNAMLVISSLNKMVKHNQEEIAQMNRARNIYATKTAPSLSTVQKLLRQIIITTEENVMTDKAMLKEANQTSTGVIIASIAIAILAVILAIVIARGIINPINKGVHFAGQLAKGDLTATIDIDQKDEIGQLASALINMGDKLRNIVEEILLGADNIASASQQMSGTSQQISQGANEQASSVEEVSSSMEEMAANIENNTSNAQQTEKIAVNSQIGVREGSEATNTAVEGMKNIAEKIRIINDIAFQTNILALNAAVEAARAGEHGKGFAVVAAEVRKLAERSKIAADEIDELSKNGVEVAERAGSKLSEIVPEIEKTAQLVQEIASASIEQNTGAGQVNNAMQQLNNITQKNAAASEEMATSSEELASQAEQLKETISFFNIGNSTAGRAKPTSSFEKPDVSGNGNSIKEQIESPQTKLVDLVLNEGDEDFEKY